MAKVSPMFHLFLVVLVIFASVRTIQVDAKACTALFSDCPNEEDCKAKCQAQYMGTGQCDHSIFPYPAICRCQYHC
ncbi:hypothetical protein MKW94_000332 [Papaver nudicaule]|uniref:Defensin n=1 Tax=Papaver nudicaule TaxID=74823 RepID=A0AA42AT40_PAPNU|nr:hypothetical protein [Papaver nudicaule]